MTKFKCKLLEDFTDEFGRQFKAGQTGVNVFQPKQGSLHVVVDFDGYEDEREQAAEFRRKHGEAANIVPWIAEVPIHLLETIE